MNTRIDRRRFLQSGSAGAIAAGAAPAFVAGTAEGASAKEFSEPGRAIPIVEEADVVVCGGGPAGIAAAIAAARAGAKTRLLEVCGCLGGIWTAGLLTWILDTEAKGGILVELMEELDRREGGLRYGSTYKPYAYDAEAMKLLLEDMCLKAGVWIQLHTRVVAAALDESKRMQLAITESKSGRQAWAGKVFVDATGDGDLAVHAGCGFDYGRPGSGKAQPMSMTVLLAGLRAEEVTPFVRGLAEPAGYNDPKTRLLNEMKSAGVSPSYSRPTLFPIINGLFAMQSNHEYGVDGFDAAEVTRATLSARSEVNRLVNALRDLGGVWKDVRLVATTEQIGVRESRRIHGLYEVSTEDLIKGARHDDAVCRCYFAVDVHAPDPTKTKGIQRESVRAKPYDIPMRALIARDVKGLLTAGRCISGDFIAHSSYRVTGNSVPMGEAAGVAAALAAKNKCLPQNVPWAEISNRIKRPAAKTA